MTSPTPERAVSVLSCAGVPIAAIGPIDAVRLLLDKAKTTGTSGTGYEVHLCNTYTLALADSDDDYRHLLQGADLNLADGTPVVWANRLMHRGEAAPHDRVRGPSLFVDVLDAGQREGIRHYLLGSTPDTLDALRAQIARRFPDALVVGAASPPFRALADDERAEQNRRIAESGAQIVWVGLGTPKQDHECARLADELPIVAVAVGAAFDFVAGTIDEAPVWMQERGVEWIHRFAAEPGRLWRRYLIGGPRFVKAVVVRRER